MKTKEIEVDQALMALAKSGQPMALYARGFSITSEYRFVRMVTADRVTAKHIYTSAGTFTADGRGHSRSFLKVPTPEDVAAEKVRHTEAEQANRERAALEQLRQTPEAKLAREISAFLSTEWHTQEAVNERITMAGIDNARAFLAAITGQKPQKDPTQ